MSRPKSMDTLMLENPNYINKVCARCVKGCKQPVTCVVVACNNYVKAEFEENGSGNELTCT